MTKNVVALMAILVIGITAVPIGTFAHGGGGHSGGGGLRMLPGHSAGYGNHFGQFGGGDFNGHGDRHGWEHHGYDNGYNDWPDYSYDSSCYPTVPDDAPAGWYARDPDLCPYY